MAAIGEQILGPTDVSLSNWTVRPSSGCSVVLATHTAGAVSVDGYTLDPGGEPVEHRAHPLYGSFVGDQGAWSTAKMNFTVPPNGVAKLHFETHFQAPGLPNQTAETVDVYGLQILDATPLLLRHEFLDLRLEDCTYTLTPGGDATPLAAGAGWARASNLVMCVSAADNNCVGVTGTFPRRVSGARRAWTSRCRQAELQEPSEARSRAGAAVGGHAGPVHAYQGLGLRGRVHPPQLLKEITGSTDAQPGGRAGGRWTIRAALATQRSLSAECWSAATNVVSMRAAQLGREQKSLQANALMSLHKEKKPAKSLNGPLDKKKPPGRSGPLANRDCSAQQDGLEQKGIQGGLRRERKMGARFGLGGVAGKGGAQKSPNSPRKLSSQTEGGSFASHFLRRAKPGAWAGLHNLGPRSTRPTFRSTSQAQTSAGQALPAGSAGA